MLTEIRFSLKRKVKELAYEVHERPKYYRPGKYICSFLMMTSTNNIVETIEPPKVPPMLLTYDQGTSSTGSNQQLTIAQQVVSELFSVFNRTSLIGNNIERENSLIEHCSEPGEVERG